MTRDGDEDQELRVRVEIHRPEGPWLSPWLEIRTGDAIHFTPQGLDVLSQTDEPDD